MNYFLLIFIPTMFYILEEIVPTKEKIFRKIGIIFIIIMTSLRYGFGADYFTYLGAFNRIKSGVFTDAFEPGYIFLNQVIAYLGLHFNFVLLIIAIFNYVLLYLTIEENLPKYKWLAMFLYLTYFDLFFYSLSAIRQSIVMSIFLYSMKYIKGKQPIKYVLWLLFGSLFHWSALILVPFYYFYNKCSEYNFRKLFFVTVGAVLAYPFLNQFIILLRPFMNRRIEYYLFIYDAGIRSNLVAATIMSILMLFWIFLSTKMKTDIIFDGGKVTKIGRKKITIPMTAMIVFFLLQVMQRTHYYSIIPRLEMYFYPFYIFAIPEAIKIVKRKDREILLFISVVFMSVFFIYKYIGVNQYASIYYETFRLIFE